MKVVIVNKLKEIQFAKLVKEDSQGDKYYSPINRGFLNRNNNNKLFRVAKSDKSIVVVEL